MHGAACKKLLVAVDGSECALEAVRYVGEILPPHGVDVVLLHVMTKIPESFWDLEKDHAFHYKIADVRAWEQQQENAVQEFMAQATEIIIDSGIPQESVIVKLEDRKIGIARDIVVESQNGYCAVVVGRRGLSNLKDLVIGSIANKLVEKLGNVPVWIVGGISHSRRILISMDASEGAFRAVDYVGKMLGGSPNLELVLFHAVRGFDVFQQILGRPFLPSHEKEWVDKAEKQLEDAGKQMEPAFEEARNRLAGLGIGPGQVRHKVVTGVSSRAGAIVDEAQVGGYDTIVVGRRGLSKVQEFLMGRVGNKVIQLAREKTVWVVN
jgi:nucleotide-binding universal stress UspA family protein